MGGRVYGAEEVFRKANEAAFRTKQ